MTQTNETQTMPARHGENGAPLAKRQPIEEREVTYMPFQSAEKITLTAGMVVKFLCKPTKRGFTCSAEHAVRFMMLCKARALNPWEGDAFLVGYDGQDGPEFNLITAHQAFLKRAEAHPEFEGMESGVMLMDDNGVITELQGDFVPPKFQLVGGWAKVYRKDRKIPCYRRLNLAVFNKGYSVWKTNPQGLITKCAEADSLRSSFPNSMAGMFSEGELGPVQVESQTVPSQPGESRTAALLAKVSSRPVSEGQTLEQTPEALHEVATEDRERELSESRSMAEAAAKESPATSAEAPSSPAPAGDANANQRSEKHYDGTTGMAEVSKPFPGVMSHDGLMEAMGGVAQAANVAEPVMHRWIKLHVQGDMAKIAPKRRSEVLAAWKAEVAGMAKE